MTGAGPLWCFLVANSLLGPLIPAFFTFFLTGGTQHRHSLKRNGKSQVPGNLQGAVVFK